MTGLDFKYDKGWFKGNAGSLTSTKLVCQMETKAVECADVSCPFAGELEDDKTFAMNFDKINYSTLKTNTVASTHRMICIKQTKTVNCSTTQCDVDKKKRNCDGLKACRLLQFTKNFEAFVIL